MRGARHALAQALHQQALADARLASDQHDLALALARQFPVLAQRLKLLDPSDKTRQALARHGAKTSRFTHLGGLVGQGQLGNPLQVEALHRVEFQPPLDQTLGRR